MEPDTRCVFGHSAEPYHAAASVLLRKFIAMIFLQKSVRLRYEKRTLFCLP